MLIGGRSSWSLPGWKYVVDSSSLRVSTELNQSGWYIPALTSTGTYTNPNSTTANVCTWCDFATFRPHSQLMQTPTPLVHGWPTIFWLLARTAKVLCKLSKSTSAIAVIPRQDSHCLQCCPIFPILPKFRNDDEQVTLLVPSSHCVAKILRLQLLPRHLSASRRYLHPLLGHYRSSVLNNPPLRS